MKIMVVKGINEDIKRLRQRVFVEEQGFVNEFDETDRTAYHAAVYENEKCIAVGRLYSDDDFKTCHIGRVAVDKEYRSCGLGRIIMKSLEEKAKELGCKKITLSAQCQAQSFYEKNGYIKTGDIYLDEHCPHIEMYKIL